MRTNTISYLHNDFSLRKSIEDSIKFLNRVSNLAAKGFTAVVTALAIVVSATWAITLPGVEQFLQASLWTSGFLFLALAIDTKNPTFGLLLATGMALPVLALLSSRVAVEFAIIAAGLVAAWVAASILKR
jgi:hypothetical protein